MKHEALLNGSYGIAGRHREGQAHCIEERRLREVAPMRSPSAHCERAAAGALGLNLSIIMLKVWS